MSVYTVVQWNILTLDRIYANGKLKPKREQDNRHNILIVMRKSLESQPHGEKPYWSDLIYGRWKWRDGRGCSRGTYEKLDLRNHKYLHRVTFISTLLP